jgi:UPF0176 protein
MSVLHNRINNKELKAKMMAEDFTRITLSFYKYFKIEDTQNFRDTFFRELKKLNVYGRIYIATEGINAQISIPETNYIKFVNYLNTLPSLINVRLNKAVDDDGKSFWKLAIKVRPNIVADGITDPNFDVNKSGIHLNAQQFNELTQKPNVLVVDMRNHYEYQVGHFNQAIEIPAETFKEQLPKAVEILQEHKDKKIIMYCTGGIRCEKASAYLLQNGFENIYQLDGGIIEYTNQAKQNNIPNHFQGINFVFDNRIGEKISNHILSNCHNCTQPANVHTNCANVACNILFIQCTSCKATHQNCCSAECQQIIALSPEQQLQIRQKVGALKNTTYSKTKKQNIFTA